MDADKCSVAMGPVCVVTGCERDSLAQTLKAVRDLPALASSSEDVIYLGRQNQQLGTVMVRTPTKLLLDLYRLHCHKLGEPRSKTILSADAQLIVVQLCLAELSKQKYGVYESDVSEVLQATDALAAWRLTGHQRAESSADETEPDDGRSPLLEAVRTLYEDFLLRSNMADPAEVYLRVAEALRRDEGALISALRDEKRLVVLQLSENPVERKFLELLCGGEGDVTVLRREILPRSLGEEDEERSSLHAYRSRWDSLEDARGGFGLSPRSPLPSSASESLVRQLCLSFLGLLVNSRDEISLARCLSYSPTGLDHQGFTALKNVAKAKKMSMYQSAVSYVTRIRLGSKGYAREVTPIAAYVKPLSEFVTNVQKLQTLVEEIPDMRACVAKVLQAVRGILCNSRGSVLKTAVVEKVCGQLREDFDSLASSDACQNDASPPKTANQGGSVLGRRSLKLIARLLDEKAASATSHNSLSTLSDYTLTQATPTRMPSLLEQFRSPEVSNPESPENKTLRERVAAPKEMAIEQKMFLGQKSDMAWAEPAREGALRERDPNVARDGAPPPGHPVKLWAQTPPEKRLRGEVFLHGDFEFDSPVTAASPCGGSRSGSTATATAADHTPKRPQGRARRPTVSAADKENLGPGCGAGAGKQAAAVKRRVKRVLVDDGPDGRPGKKPKKGPSGPAKEKTTKTTKKTKKPATLVKGQQTLSHFFRM